MKFTSGTSTFTFIMDTSKMKYLQKFQCDNYILPCCNEFESKMSWFKRGRNDSKLSSKSGSSDSLLDGRPRSETDPQTCLEVFKNHWSQAVGIINKGQIQDKGQQAIDEVDTVFQNFEQMLTLLENEEGLDDNGQGMPGPILHYLLEHEIFEKISVWCQSQTEQTDKIILEQLRLYEQLISQSHQILLIHKAVIQPLLRLLSFCEETQNSSEIEVRLVLILHQICVCISQQTLILESFFNINANHGPARFLIFSLLIPFIHRERRIGQQARDALLLIMSLSSKHPHIGQYIAEHSDFCPVLATGLSGLYSSLPRKLPNTSEDWSCITQKDITATPELQMFLNSLEFCNAVVQISDPQVRCQLIQYIYDGFLVPVLGPALHQNSREEVIAATAYLELFLRKITEPALIRAFIRFILTEQNDEIIILDSLTTRINSSSRLLCSASLSLFKTLVDLNCEDVMFEIIFKHLIPCSHVMVSQRRAVKDLDLYSKSSERFLSLRPSCLVTGSQDIPKIPDIETDRSRSNSFENSKSNFTTNSFGGKLEQYESNYIDYLTEAKLLLENCSKACTVWTYPYNGDIPPHEVFQEIMSPECSKKWLTDSDVSTVISGQTANLKSCDTSVSDINSVHTENSPIRLGNEDFKASTNLSGADDVFASDSSQTYSTIPEVSDVLRNLDWTSLDDPNSPAEDVSEFIDYLKEVGTPPEEDPSIQTSIQSLSSVFNSLRSLSSSRTSTPCTSKSDLSKTDDISVSSSLSLEKSSETVLNSDKQELKSTRDPKVKFEGGDVTTFEVIDSVNQTESSHNKSQVSETGSESWSAVNKSENKSNQQDDTSYIEITMSSLPHGKSLPNDVATLQNGTTSQCSDASTDGSTKRSVSFSLPTTSMQNSVSKVPSGAGLSNTPGIGPFLTALLTKLEGMIQNPFAVNFLLTGIISRLAAFPQPLLRSFLLSHNLVFQPTVKSLLQVIASVRQKVDHCSYTIPNFEQLLLKARMTLIVREENWRHGIDPNQIQNNAVTVNVAPPPEPIVKEKRKLSLTDLLFRRTPNSQRKTSNYKAGKGAPQLQIIPGGKGYRYVNQRQQNIPDNPMDSPKTRHSVYCAVILDEFVKELAAICQEHAVLILDEGGDDVVAFTKGRVSNEHLTHGEILTFDKTITNINAYFSADGKFVCSTPGLYAFHLYAVTQSNGHVWLELYRNDDYIVSIYGRTPSDYVDAGNSVFLNLEMDDRVYIKARDNYDNVIFGAGDQVYTTFTGVLLAVSDNDGLDAFSVELNLSIALTTSQHVLYDRIITSRGTPTYDKGTGTFTAAQSGLYIFHYHALATSDHELWLDLYYNDQYINSAYGKTPNEWADAGNTAIIHLHTGDKVSVRSRRAGGIYGDIGTNQTYTTFSGSILSPSTDYLENGQAEEIAFSVGLSAHHTQAQGHTVIFDRVFINHGLGYDTKTGKFTAKYSGIYVFHFHALSHSDKAIWIDLYHNFIYVNSIYGHVPSGYVTGSNSASLELLQGDEVFLDIKSHDTALYGVPTEIYCTFSGYLLALLPQTQNDYVGAGNSVFLNLEIDDKVYIKEHNNYVTFIFGAGNQAYTTFTGVLIAAGLNHSTLTTGQNIPYDRLITSRGTLRYNEGTGTFKASQTKLHIFHYHALATSDHVKKLWLDLYHNYYYVNSAYDKTPNGYASAGNTCILMLSRGDAVYVLARREGRTYEDIETNQTYTTFSGSTLTPYIDIEDFGTQNKG
ncbi:Protein FAM160A1,FTS and Hook-interacting protein,UPF0518 protein CPIJ015043,FTS and Hook-interacting protein homolog [Mytilus coruscus]|uniref:Protein FAM160A1,FTS and Hook-interacting protein,UPF0518 protein CPIJ015043,FTS and Hook-interacting protein homolog n=1 Tax=Mytilus coruscus TaxID=42192 RepID=A0A6J8BAC5_MYTCO|nr:Protein FAM160A1,FTS and Hook-interacting protein,UPF0518 protein CPIJ015043,FTS and Hook-interacting protein homolog [Mytilus coruscus]